MDIVTIRPVYTRRQHDQVVTTRNDMQLGVDPANRRVSQADLSAALYELSVLLPNSTIEALYKSTLGQPISIASQDQVWWFRRIEQLVTEAKQAGYLPASANLDYQIGDWKSVYQALTSSQFITANFRFIMRLRYTPLIVQVLLDLGANPDEYGAVGAVAKSGSPEALRLILSDPRVVKAGASANIDNAVEGSNIENLAILLADDRFQPLGTELHTAVQECDLEMVQMLLADRRVDPISEDNDALKEAASLGYLDIFELILRDKRVTDTSNVIDAEELLSAAIVGGNQSIVALILKTFNVHEGDWILLEAVRRGNPAMIELMLDRLPNLDAIPRAIKVAQNMKRSDVVELLSRT